MTVQYIPTQQLDRDAWHADALCSQVGSDLWFPERGQSSKAAKRVCSRCPVQARCLDAALDLHDNRGTPVSGIWGGKSEIERNAIVRERRRRAVA